MQEKTVCFAFPSIHFNNCQQMNSVEVNRGRTRQGFSKTDIFMASLTSYA